MLEVSVAQISLQRIRFVSAYNNSNTVIAKSVEKSFHE